jgi:hypothetical protein
MDSFIQDAVVKKVKKWIYNNITVTNSKLNLMKTTTKPQLPDFISYNSSSGIRTQGRYETPNNNSQGKPALQSMQSLQKKGMSQRQSTYISIQNKLRKYSNKHYNLKNELTGTEV